MRDALKAIDALKRENAELLKALETQLAKSRGGKPTSAIDGLIAKGLPNSFRDKRTDEAISKAFRRGAKR